MVVESDEKGSHTNSMVGTDYSLRPRRKQREHTESKEIAKRIEITRHAYAVSQKVLGS